MNSKQLLEDALYAIGATAQDAKEYEFPLLQWLGAIGAMTNDVPEGATDAQKCMAVLTHMPAAREAVAAMEEAGPEGPFLAQLIRVFAEAMEMTALMRKTFPGCKVRMGDSVKIRLEDKTLRPEVVAFAKATFV